MSAELVPVDPRWPGAWEQMQRWFDEALERSGADKNWGVEDLRRLALEGQLRLWGFVVDGVLRGAVATQEVTYPNRRVLELPFLGTDANTEAEWIPLFERLKEDARKAGFAALVGGGRPGWARKLGGRTVYRCEFDLAE